METQTVGSTYSSSREWSWRLFLERNYTRLWSETDTANKQRYVCLVLSCCRTLENLKQMRISVTTAAPGLCRRWLCFCETTGFAAGWMQHVWPTHSTTCWRTVDPLKQSATPSEAQQISVKSIISLRLVLLQSLMTPDGRVRAKKRVDLFFIFDDFREFQFKFVVHLDEI